MTQLTLTHWNASQLLHIDMIIIINNIIIALIALIMMTIIRSMAHVTPTYWSASQLLAEHERGQPTLINSDQR